MIRILIVDDIPLIRRLVRSMLDTEPSFQVVTEAANGREAVETSQMLQPDVILLDIGLPDMNGFEVTRLVRSVAPERKILVLSQHGGEEIVRHALAAGAHGFVVKSDVAAELIAAVKTVYDNKQFISSYAALMHS